MPIANVALNESFFSWMGKTNQLIVLNDQMACTVIAVFSTSNNTANTSNAAFAVSNGASNTAVGAFLVANTIANTAIGAFSLANTAANNAIAAFIQANNAGITALAGFRHANSSFDVANTIGSAFNQANTGTTIAITAFGHANSAFNQANTGSPAFPAANNAANTAVSAFIKANNATNTAVSAFGYANAAFDKANAATILSFSTVSANGTSVVADSNNDILTITPTAPIAITACTTTDTITIGAQASGVAAASYGGTTQMPSIVVDQFGRITSAANISFSGGSTVADQTTSGSTFYPVFTTTTTGTMTSANVATTKLYFIPSTGTLSATVFNALSDESLKENVAPIINPLEVLKSISGVSFKWKDTGHKSFGVTAQNIEKVLPELVLEINNNKTVNYNGIIAFLIQAVKEMSDKIEQLEKK